jgi:hypothetical protein
MPVILVSQALAGHVNTKAEPGDSPARKLREIPAMTQIVPGRPRMLRLNAADNVLVAIDVVDKGATAPEEIVARDRIMKGHKMAAAAIKAGEPVRKFGQIIGFAVRYRQGRLGA